MIKGLPRESFVGPETFCKETEAIFSRHWIAVGSVSEFEEGANGNLPFLKIDIGEHSVIVIRKGASELKAFHNVCRHRGTRLIDESQGQLRRDCIICPYHAWSYSTDGKLIGAPNMADVEDFERADFSLLPMACEVWADMIFLNMGNASANFHDAMQPLLSRLENWRVESLQIIKTLEYTVAANWKLLFQNYSECYHCPTVHPDLNRQTPYKSATNDLMEGPILGGPMQLADGFETVSADGQYVGEPFDTLTKEQKNSVYYYTVFPNLFVSAHPDYVMIHQLTPLDVGNTQVSCHFLSGDYATVYSLDRAWTMWDNVNQQDWCVCELTQAGARSPAFVPGPYSNLESMLAAFDRHYQEVMESPE